MSRYDRTAAAFLAVVFGLASVPATSSVGVAAGASAIARSEGEVVPLTRIGARSRQGAWSPDGEAVAFVSDHEAGWQLWIVPAAGGEPRRLTSSDDPVGWPAWSPDGGRIVFYTGDDDGYRMRALDTGTGATEPVPGPRFDAFRPLPGPDGRFLLFDAVDPDRGDHDLYVRDTRTGEIVRLTDDTGYDSDARWSPDGETIVFHSDRGAEPFQTQVWIMASDGSGPRRLTDGPAVNGYPAWSPDGRCIVYTSEIEGNRDLWLMRRDGGDRRRLTSHPGLDADPAWHPRGARILFSTDRFGGVELALLDLDPDTIRRCAS